MKAWSLILFFFSESIFYTTMSALGLTHVAGNFGFLAFNILLIILVYFNVAHSGLKIIKKNNIHLNKFIILITSLIFLLGISLLISFSKFNSSPLILQIILYYFAFAVTAFFISIILKKEDLIEAYDNMKYPNILLSIIFLLAFISVDNLETGIFHEIGGATHLLIGYTMSAFFAYNLIQFVHLKKVNTKILYLALMGFNIVLVVFSGSRGSLVSILAIFTVASIKYFLTRKKIFYLVVLSISSFIIFKVISLTNNFNLAVERMLSIFTPTKDASSLERIYLYKIAWNSFLENPFFGNSIGSFSILLNKYAYPHNFFLEVANDFGIFGIFIALVFIIIIFYKIVMILNMNYRYHLFVFWFIGVLTQLQFSGSYLVSLQFWVCITILLTIRIKEVQIKNN